MSGPTTVVPLAPTRFPVVHGAGITHRGRVRDRNEDSILTDPSGVLWAVADGMGGHGNGEVASDIVIDSLAAIRDGEEPAAALRSGLLAANAAVLEQASAPGLHGMGSTVVAAMIERAVASIAWVGDSRGYLLRHGRLRMLTRDHTLVQDMVDRGEISRDEAEHHPESHIVTRAVGGADDIEIDQVSVPLMVGDRLLLCSDGLPRCVFEPVIEAHLRQADSADDACQRLLREALENGAPDNVSAIVIDIREA